VTYGRRCLRKVAKTNPTFPYCHSHIHQRPPVKKVRWKETRVEPSPVPVEEESIVREVKVGVGEGWGTSNGDVLESRHAAVARDQGHTAIVQLLQVSGTQRQIAVSSSTAS
jgi:hypothetical protein